MKPEAILFDMDGVLVDSLNSWWLSLNTALNMFNYKEITKEEFVRKYWGYDLYDTVNRMGLDKEVVETCNNNYKNNLKSIEMYPDVIKTLEKLKGYKKGIVTNTPRNRTIQIINNFKFKQYFETVVTSNDVDRGKPYPDMILKACKNLNVETKKVFTVGDTNSDVEAGKSAGCFVIGKKIKADYTIYKLSDLLNIFDKT